MTISEQVSPKASHQIEANGLSLSAPGRVPLPVDAQHLPKPPSVSERYAYLKPPSSGRSGVSLLTSACYSPVAGFFGRPTSGGLPPM